MQYPPPVFGADPVQALGPLVGRLAAAAAVVFVTWRAAVVARHWFDRVTARSQADVNLRVLVGRFLYVVVLVFGLSWGLEVLGVNPATVVTGLGILGLAASLALQDILKNFCAGVYLLFERPFRIGDEITVRDLRGYVVDVGIRTTSLRTEDDLQVMIPNAVVLAEIVINRSSYQPRPAQEARLLRDE